MSCCNFEEKVTIKKVGFSIDGCNMSVTVTARGTSSCSKENAYEKAKSRANTIIDKTFLQYKCKD